MEEIKKKINDWLNDSQNDNEISRAKLVRYVLHDVIYHFVKFERPGGEGLDGRDGDERQALAKVVDAAEDYYYDVLERNISK